MSLFTRLQELQALSEQLKRAGGGTNGILEFKFLSKRRAPCLVLLRELHNDFGLYSVVLL
jgi:hypothetical protein